MTRCMNVEARKSSELLRTSALHNFESLKPSTMDCTEKLLLYAAVTGPDLRPLQKHESLYDCESLDM